MVWAGCPRCLLLVYRPERLERQLADPAVRSLLLQEGYPVEGGLEAMLETLTCRLAQEDFPHEVGLFLGYPHEDVEGFREQIFAQWADEADGQLEIEVSPPDGVTEMTAYLRIQLRFTYGGCTHTLWQNLPIHITTN